MSDIKEETINQSGGKKQFYALNLTPERIFLIFVSFVILIAVVIIFVAFTFSKKPSSSNQLTGSEYDFLNDITNPNYDYHALLVNDQSIGFADDVFEENTASVRTVNTESPAGNERSASSNEQRITVNDDKVVYSSALQTSEPVVQRERTAGTAVVKPVPQARTVTPAVRETAAVARPAASTPASQTVQAKTVSPAKTASAVQAVKPVTTAQVPKKTQNEKFVIQIASYSNKKLLEEVSQFYKNAGYPVYVREFTKDGQTFYRLRIGPYDERKVAEDYLATIKNSKFGKDSFISVGYF